MEIAFYLPGSIPIYSFSLLLGIGASVGLWVIARHSDDQNKRVNQDAGLWVLLAAFVGARTGYVVGQWPYFKSNAIEILEVYRGGLSWPGAIMGAILALFVLARNRRIPAGLLADALLPLSASLAISAWLGCWMSGCAYGFASNAWWALPAADEWGELSARWPVQLVGALLTFSIFWLLEKKRASFPTPGQAASIFLTGAAVIMFGLTYLRADPMPVWNGLRWDAWAALIFSLSGLLSLLLLKNSKQIEPGESILNPNDS